MVVWSWCKVDFNVDHRRTGTGTGTGTIVLLLLLVLVRLRGKLVLGSGALF